MTRTRDMAAIPVVDEIPESTPGQHAAALRILAGGARDAGELREWAEMCGIPLPEKTSAKGNEPMTDTRTPGLTEVRHNLYSAYQAWDKRRRPFDSALDSEERVPGAEVTAHGACLMAASYSYALAAVLKVAADDFGTEVADALAAVAAGLLENGDPDNLNADLDPAGEGQSS